MAEVTEDGVLGALESAFGDAPAPAKAPAAPKAAPAPVEAAEPAAASDDSDPEGLLTDAVEATEPAEVAEGEEAAPVAEPEFEIEVNGAKEVVKGADKIKELLQKGAHYSRGTEEVARVREALVVQAQQQQAQAAFQQASMPDIIALQQIDARLAEFNAIDWNAAIDQDFVGVMKLQAQRAQLNEMRNAKLNELNAKHQQFQQGQAQAAQQLRAAEESALLAKLPDWRNSDKAQTEKQAIAKTLMDAYGFHPAEVAQLMDHRMVVAGRDLMLLQQLRQNKAERLKQVRDAPPVVKPGAAQAAVNPHSKAGFQKFRQELKVQGQKGNHRAQEELLTKAFSRAFK